MNICVNVCCFLIRLNSKWLNLICFLCATIIVPRALLSCRSSFLCSTFRAHLSVLFFPVLNFHQSRSGCELGFRFIHYTWFLFENGMASFPMPAQRYILFESTWKRDLEQYIIRALKAVMHSRDSIETDVSKLIRVRSHQGGEHSMLFS